jgi:dinuclear metal center YbgI/SA1388 family protein
MPAARDEIVSFCDELLDVPAFDDYGPNGLQVPGAGSVSVVATAVSANLATLRGASEAGAELILTHHGLFWEFLPRALTPQMAARLRLLLEGETSLAAYHLPLDAHPDLGNNSLLCRELGLEPSEPFGEARGRPIGFVGRSAEGIPASDLFATIAVALGREPLVQGAGPQVVRSAGVVTGAGAGTIGEAVRLGLDALITGEPAEHAMADAAEGGLHFVAAGHYATETLGIRRLGDLVAERFDVHHEFIDVPNPV